MKNLGIQIILLAVNLSKYTAQEERSNWCCEYKPYKG